MLQILYLEVNVEDLKSLEDEIKIGKLDGENGHPQYITPMGFCYVKANFTTEARFELNASRHELNNNREVINKWNKKIGNIIQKKVAENCISVLRENNIDFEINNLLAQDEEDPFAKENVLLMRKVLNELLYENTCNLPCTNK